MKIRNATEKDYRGIYERENTAEYRRLKGRPHRNFIAFKKWIAARKARGSIILIAEDNGKQVGSVMLIRWLGNQSHNMGIGISVDKAYAGKGIGKALMKAALKRAKSEKGVRRISYACYGFNKPSLALVKSLGFKRCGKSTHEYLINEKYVDYYYFEKLI